MKDCKICTDDGYKINREGYTLCKQHYEEVEDVFKQIERRKNESKRLQRKI
tara:strand:- start:2051 stop:2203 length:153 start_codon:yes stop_codon:yes gene_type:complete